MGNLQGTTLKGYHLLDSIGGGGFGDVYLAKQSTIAREVAIKVIRQQYTNDPDFIRRFEAEANLIARLEHPHITPLHDFWRDPNGAYLVMRFLRGGSIRNLLDTSSYELHAISQLLDQIASALDFAHRNDVIHRDIKPGNILLDEDGNAYLADFGIAKDLTGFVDNKTAADAVVGSLDYIAPEQARSEPVTPRTDIYSLGVTLYEMITGEHPFSEFSTIERLYKHINDPLPYIENLPDDVQTVINNIIQKATAKDPDKRYEDVLALAVAFREGIGRGSSTQDASVIEELTMREHEILGLIAKGMSNRQIADHLVVTVSTVKWHINQLYKKLGVTSRVQAIVRARELNLIITGDARDDFAPTVSSTQSISLPEPDNPYKGLHAFQMTDSRDFFGRDELVQKLIEQMNSNDSYSRFLSIVGPSGSGKSSLVKAGLIPALWKGNIPGSEKWFVVDMMPGTHPLDKLEIALLRVAANHSDNLHEQLQRDDRGLLRVADLILPGDDSELVIVVDQFEEVFTLVEDEDTRQKFLDLLRVAVSDMRSRVRVIITLRADYYDRPLHYPEFGELLRSRMETVMPLSAKGLERAIQGPAERVGVTFEQGLVAEIVADMNYQSGALPLLQYALTELFDRREGRLLTQSAYQEIGGAVGALANRADEIFRSMTDEAQALAHQMFMRLVTLGEGAEDTRRRATHSELLSLTDNTDLMEEIIDQFSAYRLLSLDNDPETRQPTIEVAHEAILREWERLRAWLNESRDDIRQERDLAHAVADWDTNNRDSSFLLQGTRLEQVEAWQKNSNLTLTPLESYFIETSLVQRKAEAEEKRKRIEREKEQEARTQASDKRSRKFLQALVAVFALATILSGGLAFVANTQRVLAEELEQEALIQASIGLAAQVRLDIFQGVPQRGVLVALEALEQYPYTWQAERALFQAVTENRILMRLEGHSDEVNRVVWSPDQSQLASVSYDGTAIIWDALTGEISHVLEGHTEIVWDADWSPDGTQLATADSNGIGIVWDARTGNERYRIEHEDFIATIEWSPDGTSIATASHDDTVKIWDATSGDNLFTLSGHNDDVWEVFWSPDSETFATTGSGGATIVWDRETGEQRYVLVTESDYVSDGEWSPDGTQIITANGDNRVHIWDAETGEEVLSFPGEDRGSIKLAWSPDGSRILSVENGHNQVDGVATIHSATTGELLHRLPGVNDLSGGAWSPDGSQVAVTDESEIIRIWDANTGELRDIIHHTGLFMGTEISVQWSSDGQQILVHAIDGVITIYDASGIALDTIYGQTPATAWSPDGSAYIRNDEGGGLIIADTASGDTLLEIPGVVTFSQKWSPDGQYIVAVDDNQMTRLWNASSGEELLSVDGNSQVTWSPDSRQFAVPDSSMNVVYVYDVATGERVLTLANAENYYICEVEWSPDGTRIAGGILSANSSLTIWDATSGEEISSYEIDDFPCQIDWSQDSTRIVAPANDRIHIIEAETGEILLTFAGHTGFINSGEFSPDDSRVVSSGDDATRIWDAVTGAEYGVLDIQDWQAHWSPDGDHILTIGPAGILRIWRTFQSGSDLVDYAYHCCVFSDLTADERLQFGLSQD